VLRVRLYRHKDCVAEGGHIVHERSVPTVLLHGHLIKITSILLLQRPVFALLYFAAELDGKKVETLRH
jgi:hypothetical protein